MGTNTILLVDDSPDDVFLTVHAFRKSKIDCEIIVAADGVEAVDLLLPKDGTPACLPSIILLDFNMPRMGGLEVLTLLRANPVTRLLPVIMLTTSDQEDDIAGSYLAGANSYVQKPVDPAGFMHAVEILGIYWFGINRSAGPGE